MTAEAPWRPSALIDNSILSELFKKTFARYVNKFSLATSNDKAFIEELFNTKTKAEALNFIANKGAFRGGGGSFSVDTASVVNTFTNKSEVASIVAENKERGGEIS